MKFFNEGSVWATLLATMALGSCLHPANLHAAISYVQGNYAAPQNSLTTVSVTFSAAQLAGDLNVVAVGWSNSTATVSGISDTRGNVYVRAVGPTVQSGFASQSIYYAKNILSATTGSNTITVTFSTSAAFPDIRILEYSGADPNTPVDVTVANKGNSTTSNSGSVVTTNATDLLFAANLVQTSTKGPGAGYTSRLLTQPNGDIAEDRKVTAVGTYSATAPLTSSGRWIMQMVAFRAASGDTTPPTAPSNLTATLSGSQINLSWTASTDNVGVTGYRVERCQGPGCSSFVQIATATTTTYSDTGLGAGSYSYRVRATDAAGNLSPYSNIASATIPDTQPPTAPSGLTATGRGSQINLAWTASTDNVGVTGYLLERCQGAGCSNFAQIATSTVTTYIDTGLALDSYSYRVRANDAVGNLSSYSNVATATITNTSTPTAPSNMAANTSGPGPVVQAVQSYINSTFLTTHTTAPFDSTGGGFMLICASSHAGVTLTPSDSFGNTWISIGGPTNTPAGFDLRTQLWYTRNPTVGSGHTVIITLSTAESLAISIFVVKGSNISSPIDAVSPIGSDNGTQTVNVASPSITTTATNDLLIGFVKVSAGAVFQSGPGFVQQPAASSNFLDAETGPAATAGIYSATFTLDQPQTWQATAVAVANNPNQSVLSWTASSESGGTISDYLVERCQGPACNSFAQISTTTLTTFNDSSLAASTSYSYRVRAQDTVGVLGPYSTVVTITTPVPVPSLPGNLSATAVSASQISLSWTASAETGGTISAYSVERCQGDGCSNFSQIGTAATTAFSDTKLTSSTSYTYRVRAVDAFGNMSPYSNLASAVTRSNVPAISYVQGNSATPQSSPTSVTVVFSSPQIAGDLNVVVVGWNNTTATLSAISDTSGNTYARAVGPTLVNGSLSQSIYYAKNILSAAGGANSVKVTFSSAAAFPDIRILEYNGADPNNPVDVAAANTGNSATSSSGVATTTYPADLLFGANMVSTTTVGPGSGFTNRLLTSPDGDIAEDQMVTATGTYSATAPLSSPGPWIMQMVAFHTPVGNAAPPTTPTNVSATAAGATQINLSWTASTSTIGIAYYVVQRCQGAGCTNFAKVATPSGTAYIDTGLLPATSYSYEVQAVDSAANSSAFSSPPASASTQTAQPPSAPTNLMAQAAGASQINLSWTVSTSNVGIANYVVQRCQGQGCTNFAQVAAPTGTTYTDSGLTPNTTYNYEVQAVDTLGNASPFSTPASATTGQQATTITYVQGNYATPQSSQTTVNVVFSGAQTAANLNVAVVAWNDTVAAVKTVSDKTGNVYTLAVGPTLINGSLSQSIYYAKNIASAAAGANTVTVTFSQAAAYPDIRILEYAGVDSSTPVDVTAAGTGTNATSSSGPATTTNAADLLVAANIVATQTTAAGSGFTQRLLTSPDGDIVEDQMVTAAGSYTATAPLSGSGSWIMQMVAFRAAGGAPPVLSILPRASVLTFNQTQQFIATNTSGAVSWSVDSIQGGSASIGTITTSGLYTPPASVGSHTITASSGGQSVNATAYVTNYPGTFTYHNDNLRTGQNLAETVLTLNNVNSNQFGKLFSYPLDGIAFASPLYVANVSIPGKGSSHNVVYVATEHDSVYAFDADGITTTPLWKISFLSSGVTTVPCADTGECGDIPTEIGITSTPVIDPSSGTMYVVAATKEGSNTWRQRLHALDITTGTEKFGGPVLLQASVPGSGTGSSGGNVTFDALRENQRPGLLLNGGVVYLAFGSHGDHSPWHGWVLGYNATTLQQTMKYNATPNGNGGGIWQGGGGLATDATNDIYFVTSNGDFDVNTGGVDYGDSVEKLTPGGVVVDYFTPDDQQNMSVNNLDLGAGGPVMLLDQTVGTPHLLITAGKNGTIYVINRDNMGKFNSNNNNQIVQSLNGVLLNGNAESGNFSTPVYFNGYVYFAAVNDTLKAFQLTNGLLSTSPVSQSSAVFPCRGGSFAISANGGTNGILWAIQNLGDPNNDATMPGVLIAYDATNLKNELYDSSQATGRDTMDYPAKFSVPLVANGKVFVAGQTQLIAYGLLQ